MIGQEANTLWVKGFTADGFQVGITLAITSVADAIKVLVEIRAAGFIPHEAQLEPGAEKETIAVVMRRESADGTQIIDFYPEWAEHKYAHMYLNTEEQRTEFEAQSGLILTQISLYDGQQAYKRVRGKPSKYETAVKRSFAVTRVQVGEHEAGMPKYRYGYFQPINKPAPKQLIVKDEKSQPLAINPGDKRLVQLKTVEIRKRGNGRMLAIVAATGEKISAFSREEFIKAGYIDENDWQQAGVTHQMSGDVEVDIVANDKGFWELIPDTLTPFDPKFNFADTGLSPADAIPWVDDPGKELAF